MSLVLELGAPRRVRAGTSVTLVLRLRNTASQPTTVYLRGRSIVFDFIVSDKQGVVWQRLHGQTVPAIARVVELAPGDVIEYSDEWPLRDNDGQPVTTGHYTVVGLLLRDEPEPLRTEPQQLEIS